MLKLNTLAIYILTIVFIGSFSGTFLIFKYSFFNKIKSGLFIQAILCFAFEIVLWAIPLILLAGFDTKSIVVNIITVGISSAFVPCLHKLLTKVLGIY
jgi:hypothetical protein